ncbi:HEXXH motif-containing putative peptide modification protein [Actinosynnema sp. NPDC050436]|uniref:aKG-HExxH-type peptide beta-hydroxylase n=1 Tax=Actinosynnema sp. NPDC050436 TaxID=3155659 RepID=UPI0033D83BE2
MRTFAAAAESLADRLGPFADVARAWALLAEAERVAPAVVEELLLLPSVGVWLSRVLRHTVATAPDATPLRSEVGGFHALAAAAAVRSGLPCEVPVPVVHGVVTLPSVGAYRPATGFPVGHAVLRHDAHGTALVVRGKPCAAAFEPVKRHRSAVRGRSVELTFDDLDPYREFGAPVRPRPLGEAEYAEWRKLMDESWDLLTHAHPAWAEELAACLSTVTPLDAGLNVFAASSTAAFGAVAMSPKRSAAQFGEALVHELQHSKVNALMDLVDLYEGDDVERFYAPWRDEPRHVAGLLHGVYAFVTVVEYWNVQRRHLSSDDLAAHASFSHALRARQVAEVVDTLRGLTELTDLGRHFAATASVRLAAATPTDLPDGLAEAVSMITDAHRATWRLRHAHPDRAVVADLADAWCRGLPPGPAAESHVEPSGEAGTSPLEALLRLHVLDPYRARGLAGRPGPDVALVHGDRAGATTGYLARLRAAPGDSAAWVGLGVALGSPALRLRPELVRAVHHRVATRSGAAPDPADLAAWFDQAAG